MFTNHALDSLHLINLKTQYVPISFLEFVLEFHVHSILMLSEQKFRCIVDMVMDYI